MMRTSPMVAFAGTPIYNLYLRLMGAKIGRNAVISCRSARSAPTCFRSATTPSCARTRSCSATARSRTSSTSARSRSAATPSSARRACIDIDTAMGDDTQLGHASSLQSGQRVPDGKRYHGSPAVETHVRLLPDREPRGRRAAQRRSTPRSSSPRCSSSRCRCRSSPITSGISMRRPRPALASASSALSLLGISAGAVLRRDRRRAGRRSTSIPRLCMLFLKPGVTYPAFGFHYLMQSIILRVSNSRILLRAVRRLVRSSSTTCAMSAGT